MTTKQIQIYSYIKKRGGQATVRQVIDYCKTNAVFINKYHPESAKMVYLNMIKNGYLKRIKNVLIINKIKENELWKKEQI